MITFGICSVRDQDSATMKGVIYHVAYNTRLQW